MKYQIFASVLGLLLSPMLMAFEIEKFSFTQIGHLKAVSKFCQRMKLADMHPSFLGNDCSTKTLTTRMNSAFLDNTKEVLLVYDALPGEVVAVLRVQFIREGTTALLSGSFLTDFSEVYKAAFERVRTVSQTDNVWRRVEWLAIHREALTRMAGVDEKQFPILFSMEEQLFSAILIAELPLKYTLETDSVSSHSIWFDIGVALTAAAVPALAWKVISAYWPAKKVQTQEVGSQQPSPTASQAKVHAQAL